MQSRNNNRVVTGRLFGEEGGMASSAGDLARMVQKHDQLLAKIQERLAALEEEVRRVLGGDALDDE